MIRFNRPKALTVKTIFIVWALVIIVISGIRIVSQPLSQRLSFSQIVRAKNGELLRVTLSRDDKYRFYQPLEKIPQDIQSLLLTYEDKYFFYHPGFNPISLFGAIFKNLRSDQKFGASTITMQVVRLLYSLNTKSVWGKFKQILMAIGLEVRYSKKEILETYFQVAPYGSNIEGLSAAAFIYIDKSLDQLTLEQAAALLLIPQNPNVRSLSLDPKRTEAWRAARSDLISRWNSDRPDKSIDLDSVQLPLVKDRRERLPFWAPHFVQMVLDRSPFTSELTTTLEIKKQNMFEKILRQYISRHKEFGINNASALLVNTNDLSIEAYLGSVDFWNNEIQGQVDGVQARRSPGSALKPFIYALAMDAGIIHPMSLLRDTPQSFHGFDPENFERGFRGPLSATDALIKSRNIPAVDLAMKLTGPTPYEFLKKLDVPLWSDPSQYGLTVVLGGAEVSMANMAVWYSALARQKRPEQLRWLASEGDSQSPQKNWDWGISPESGYLVLQMLKENLRDDLSRFDRFRRDRYDVAWKTGTSTGFRDAWTVGVFDNYFLAVWLGNFDGTSNPGLIGRQLAAPLFFQLADATHQLTKNSSPSFFENGYSKIPPWQNTFGLQLGETDVCELSGALPTEACRQHKNIQIIPGKTPLEKCEIHKKIAIAKKTGLRMCPNPGQSDAEIAMDTQYEIKTFEVWPSELLATMKDSGIHAKPIPPYPTSCRGTYADVENSQGLKIVSPREGVKYNLQWNTPSKSQLSLMAQSDLAKTKLSWFIRGELVGQSAPGENLYWSAQPGHYAITVIDNYGRTASREVDVELVGTK